MKRILALLISLALLLSLCACTVEENAAADGGYMLWFAVARDSKRNDSAAVYREMREWSNAPSAYGLIAALLRGPQSEDLYSPFPPNTSLNFLLTEGETAWVDLSEEYASLSGVDLTIADYCIALTLCQLPEIESVKITVKGESIQDRNRQTLREGDVLLSGIEEEPDTFLAALYFPDSSEKALTVEYRQVVRAEDQDAVDVVMEELLHGPMEGIGSRSMPTGTRARSLAVSDGICYVDLSREFVTNAPQTAEEAGLMLYALVNTLCVRSGVSQVQLLIEGERVDFYGSVSVRTPLSANFDLVSN